MSITNAWRRFRALAPYMLGVTKHDHYSDFGWPEELDFQMLLRMYRRNGLARAAVAKTAAKTWETFPELWESERPAESTFEADVRAVFEKLRLWQKLVEADRMSMVGSYAALVIRYRDGLTMDQPVGRMMRGLTSVAGVIPLWKDQITVSATDADVRSENYGEPTMYSVTERLPDGTSARVVQVHPSRVLLWSANGTMLCESMLGPGFNDLIDLEKVKGAGGEGFWKSSRGAPVITSPEGVQPDQIARNMGVTVPELLDKMNDQIELFQKGFDKALLLGGMQASPLSISLPSPEHFIAGPLNSFAASIQMPVKILVGSQTGERASTEDSREWAMTCNSRRVNICRPLIMALIRDFVRYGVLPERDYHLHWSDLTESSAQDKLQRAKDLSAINAQVAVGEELIFTGGEIRLAAGYEALPALRDDDDDDE